MNKIKRKFTPSFKSKVVLELIKGAEPFSTICSRYNLHPTQARRWKEQAIAGLEACFVDNKGDELKAKNQLIDELYKQIGQLTVERDWLKKKT